MLYVLFAANNLGQNWPLFILWNRHAAPAPVYTGNSSWEKLPISTQLVVVSRLEQTYGAPYSINSFFDKFTGH